MGSREEVPPQDMSQDQAGPVGPREREDCVEAPELELTLERSRRRGLPSYHLAYRLM